MKITIDENTFPDTNFRYYVSISFDTERKGFLTENKINSVETIDCDGNSITSLQGIEYFAALKKLNCKFNFLKELNISKNANLTTLICSYNRLTNLDVSQSTALETLDCRNNQLSILDISRNPVLATLYSSDNDLIQVNRRNNEKQIKINRKKLSLFKRIKRWWKEIADTDNCI